VPPGASKTPPGASRMHNSCAQGAHMAPGQVSGQCQIVLGANLANLGPYPFGRTLWKRGVQYAKKHMRISCRGPVWDRFRSTYNSAGQVPRAFSERGTISRRWRRVVASARYNPLLTRDDHRDMHPFTQNPQSPNCCKSTLNSHFGFVQAGMEQCKQMACRIVCDTAA